MSTASLSFTGKLALLLLSLAITLPEVQAQISQRSRKIPRPARSAPAIDTPVVLPGTSSNKPNILIAIADDWAFPHAGAYGDRIVKTPNIDRLAREGVLFRNAFCASPSCTPSRAAILTGQAVHRLREGGNLWGFLPSDLKVYPDLLESAGYAVAHQGKGWGPGNFRAGGRERNPAGPQVKSFSEFMTNLPAGKPFCFWFGSQDPHRPYARDSGINSGKDPKLAGVPPYWPDTADTRSDLLDYYLEVERFDAAVGNLLGVLENRHLLDKTLIVITSDNGMPFPRGKANLYDAGSHVPLVIRWPDRFRAGGVSHAFVTLADLAPTFLQAAGLPPRPEMTGRTLLGLNEPDQKIYRSRVFLERERHANVRRGDLSYPSRAIRTDQFLYIWNLRPERWPAGDPEKYKSVGNYGDCDNSPTKQLMLKGVYPEKSRLLELSFGKRPEEELYDLRKDPHQVKNIARNRSYFKAKQELSDSLKRWMDETADPRVQSDASPWDSYPYFGPAE